MTRNIEKKRSHVVWECMAFLKKCHFELGSKKIGSLVEKILMSEIYF